MGEVTVSVGGVLTELIVILLGVPLAAPPLGKTGKLPEQPLRLVMHYFVEVQMY